MRKLIETEQKCHVVCDNPMCDYESPTDDNLNLIDYVNKPCPKCGENLCTPEDYKQYMSIVKVVNWINRWFSWLTIFASKKDIENATVISVHVHNGIHIKNEEDEK